MFRLLAIAALVSSVAAFASKFVERYGNTCSTPAKGQTLMAGPWVILPPDNSQRIVSFYKKGDNTKAAVTELSVGTFIVELDSPNQGVVYFSKAMAPEETKINGAPDVGVMVGCNMKAGNIHEVVLNNANKELNIYVFYAREYSVVSRFTIKIPAAAPPTNAPAPPTNAPAPPTNAPDPPTEFEQASGAGSSEPVKVGLLLLCVALLF